MATKKPGRIKSALLNWLGVPISATTGAFWSEFYGESASGKVVTINKSLQLSTTWACVRLLSETISTLPIRLYERRPDGSRRVASDHPLFRVICKQPNAEMTPSRYMNHLVASLCLRGNAYSEKKMVGNRVIALDPLLPQNMAIKRLDSGKLEYTYTEKNATRVIPEARLMHIRGFGLDGVCGLNPVHTGRDVFGGAMSADEAAYKIFAEGLHASGIMSADGTMTEAQRDKFREKLKTFMGSKNAGKILVAEAGMKYQSITMNPEAAQMLQTRAFSVEEICRWFRVPPFMVGHMDKQSSWASSVEGLNMQFLTNTLRPILENIEQEIDRCLLNNDERFYVEFNVEGLLRADSAGRASYYTQMLQNGVFNRNEVRQLENQPPMPGGDIYTVQSNMIALERLGETNDSEQARAALRRWLTDPETPSNS